MTFPEDYGNERLAGNEAIFECTVQDILQAVPAEIDDKLAEAVGLKDLAELKEKVSEQIGEEHNRMTRDRMKREMLDILAEEHDFEIPSAMADIEFDTIWAQVEKDRERGVVDPDDEGKEEEDLKAEYRGIAERRVRLGLLLSEVGRRNELEVSQDELNAAMVNEARRYPGQEQQVFKFYQEERRGHGPSQGTAFRREGHRLHRRARQGERARDQPRRSARRKWKPAKRRRRRRQSRPRKSPPKKRLRIARPTAIRRKRRKKRLNH